MHTVCTLHAHSMQDFVADNTLRFGWRRQLGAAAMWLGGLAAAAAATRTPVQLCLATASDLMHSLASPWVTQAIHTCYMHMHTT